MAGKSLNIKITGNSDNAKKAVKDLDKETQGLNKTVDTLKAAFVGLATIQTVKMAYAMAGTAALNERVATTFDNTAKRYGIDSKDMMNALDNVTKKTIDDDEIMAKVNQTLSTGIVTRQEDIVDIMEIARRKGKEMGVDTLTAYDSIINGIEGMNEKMLRNSGIIVDTTELFRVHAAELGKDTSELTDNEKQQELLWYITGQVSDQIKAQGEDVVDATDKFDQMKRKMGDVKDDIGAALLPAFSSIWNYLDTDLIPKLGILWQSTEDVRIQFAQSMGDAINTFMSVSSGLIGYLGDNTYAVSELKGAFMGLAGYVATLKIFSVGSSLITFFGTTLPAALATSQGSFTLLAGGIAAIPTAITIAVAIAGFSMVMDQINQLKKNADALAGNAERANSQTDEVVRRIKEAEAVGDTERAVRLRGILTGSVSTSSAPTGLTNYFGTDNDLLMGGEMRASGGPVSSGSPYIVGEEGPEMFVPSQSGSIVPNGPVSSGSPYIVGEQGPEMFVPRQSGQIVPNGAMGGFNVGTVNINNNMDWAIFKRQLAMELAIR